MEGGGVDWKDVERKRFESLKYGVSPLEDALKMADSVMKRALDSGQIATRLQILHLPDQYQYINKIEEEEDRILDAITLLPFENVRVSVRLSKLAQDFFNRIQQRYRCKICFATNQISGSGKSKMEVILDRVLYLVAIREPTVECMGAETSLVKCLDQDAFRTWDKRVENALCAGILGPVCIVLLYKDSDYTADAPSGGKYAMHCVTRETTRVKLALDKEKHARMIDWANRSCRRAWNLAIADEKNIDCAYFVVLIQ